MSTEMQTKVQASPAQNFTPVQTGLLQGNCTLCNTPGLVEDSKQNKEKLTLQRSSANQTGTTTVPPIVHEVLRSPGKLLDPVTPRFIEPRFGHDFSRVRVHSPGPGMIQAKLKINETGDIYEQEADRVADAVMRIPEQVVRVQLKNEPEEDEEELIQTKWLSEQITPVVQKQREEKDYEKAEEHIQTKLLSLEHPILQRQEEEFLQTKEIPGQIPEVTPNLEARINAMRGSGQPLPESVRAFFEPHFGVDFSKVRVHTNTTAQESAKAIQAEAFTVGNNIIFGQGHYTPETYIGRRLFGHELTHVVQQRNATTISTTPITSFTDQTISRYPRSYAQAHPVRGGGPFPHLRLRGLDVDREIAHRIELALGTHDRGSADITRLTGNGWICEMTETSWGATGIRDMRLVYIDDELRTVRRAWRVQNDTVAELSEPGIDEAYQLISQDSDELAGERARVLTTPDPDQLRYVFDMTSDRAWHRIFPQSTIPEGRIRYIHGRANRRSLDQEIRQRPSLGGRHYTPDRVAIEDDANISALRELVINAINRRLDSIHTAEALAERGHMILWHTPGTSNWGWFYAVGGAQQDYPAAQQHREFLRSLTANDLGLQGDDLVRWPVYRYLNAEGDTSAINAYDNQYVTIGSGFGARYGRVGQVYNYMPPQFLERLYMHGILVNPDNTFTILDLNRGVVEHGDNALRILQVDERRLGLLVHESQSEREITHGSETREQRLWMVRAQMLEATREIPISMLSSWPIDLLKFAARCNHWQPSTIPYQSYLELMPHNLNVIATRVRNRIWLRRGRRASGDYSFADIEGRMRGWARAAGAGTISFGPPP